MDVPSLLLIAFAMPLLILGSLIGLNDDNKQAAARRLSGQLYPNPRFDHVGKKRRSLIWHGLMYVIHILLMIVVLMLSQWKVALLGGILWLPILIVHTVLWLRYYRRWSDPLLVQIWHSKQRTRYDETRSSSHTTAAASMPPASLLALHDSDAESHHWSQPDTQLTVSRNSSSSDT